MLWSTVSLKDLIMLQVLDRSQNIFLKNFLLHCRIFWFFKGHVSCITFSILDLGALTIGNVFGLFLNVVVNFFSLIKHSLGTAILETHVFSCIVNQQCLCTLWQLKWMSDNWQKNLIHSYSLQEMMEYSPLGPRCLSLVWANPHATFLHEVPQEHKSECLMTVM